MSRMIYSVDSLHWMTLTVGLAVRFLTIRDMIHTVCANLAVCVLLAVLHGFTAQPPAIPEYAQPEEPIRVSFRLTDGMLVVGDLRAWDHHGIDGTFGPRPWSELRPDDVWRLYRMMYDESIPAHWAALGDALLRVPDGEAHAERAFRRALRDEPGLAEFIEQLRSEYERERQAAIAAEAAERQRMLELLTPEARPWGTTRWPTLSEKERQNAVLTMRADAQRMLSEIDVVIEPVEAEYVILYTDLERPAAARVAMQLDELHEQLCIGFAIDDPAAVYWGKLVVFLHSDPDRYRAFEESVFDRPAPEHEQAVTHYEGPKVFINATTQRTDRRQQSMLRLHATLGFLHRHHTPHRLPAWANHGFANLMAEDVYRGSQVEVGTRPRALEIIRSGAPFGRVFSFDYRQRWSDRDREGIGVSTLTVEYLAKLDTAAFRQWVTSVKLGSPWEQALADAYGMRPAELVERVRRFYLVND